MYDMYCMYIKHKEVEVMQKIRKNILLSPEENDLINNFADRVGLNIFEIFIKKFFPQNFLKNKKNKKKSFFNFIHTHSIDLAPKKKNHHSEKS